MAKQASGGQQFPTALFAILGLVVVVAIVGVLSTTDGLCSSSTFQGVQESDVGNAAGQAGLAGGKKPKPIASCVDTDGGIVIYTKGTVTVNGTLTVSDSCLSSQYLYEMYCNGFSVEYVKMTCSHQCVNGACVNQTQCVNECTNGASECLSSSSWRTCGNYDADSCTEWSAPSACGSGTTCQAGFCTTQAYCNDTDGGLNYYLRGTVTHSTGVDTDTCVGNTLNESYCSGTTHLNQMFPCSYQCVNGACVNQTVQQPWCYDSDGGQSIYVKGTVMYFNGTVNGTYADTCINETLKEGFCSGTSPASSVNTCPWSCSNGACVNQSELRYLGYDSVQSLAEFNVVLTGSPYDAAIAPDRTGTLSYRGHQYPLLMATNYVNIYIDTNGDGGYDTNLSPQQTFIVNT